MIVRIGFAAILATLWVASATAQEKPRFIMVTHGAATDPFWAMVKEGAEAGAKQVGAELVYRAPESFDLDTMATLVSAAVEEAPAGLIVSIPNADALAPSIRAAVDRGIPVISINSGYDVARSLGALLHVGQSEYEAGRVAGEAMRGLGGRSALCINHELGNVALDLRCKGFIDGFGGSVEVLPAPPDTEDFSVTLGETLAKNEAIDTVLALSASVAGEPAIRAAEALAGTRTLRVGTFDVTPAVLEALADRRAAFAIDQQPFLQGFLPVDFLALWLRHGAIPVSNVSTGPRLIMPNEALRRLGRPVPAEPAQPSLVPLAPAAE